MERDEFMDLVGADYVDEYDKAQLSQEGTTKDATSDTISRQAAIDAAESAYVRGMFPTPFIREVPPAQKQLTEEEVIICKMYLEDLGSHKTCNEYKLLMGLLDGTTTVAKSKRTFVELRAEYQHPDLCTYPEYKGKPYYSIKYIEDGECFVGFGTYKPEVLSQYLRDYFMPPVQPEEVIPVSWIEAKIKRFKAEDNAFCGLTANIMHVMLNEWKREQEGETT